MIEDYATFVARVAAIVARYEMLGVLPTLFEVTRTELENAAIVRAKMIRIDSRGVAPIDPTTGQRLIYTTAKEVILVGATDAEIHLQFQGFTVSLWDHERRETLKLDGELVDDPHAEDAA